MVILSEDCFEVTEMVILIEKPINS